MNLKRVSSNKKASFFKLLISELSTSLRKARVLNISLIEIPIFERHVVNRCASKHQLHKDTCLKEIGLHFRFLSTTLYSISRHN